MTPERTRPSILQIILDLLALLLPQKPPARVRRPGTTATMENNAQSVWHPDPPMPLTADEAVYYAGMPLDHRGAPHVRSQPASFVAERAAIEAGRMKLYSFDDDINARHYIARYERAGLAHLAVSHRRKLAEFRAAEATAGHKFEPGNRHIARDCEAEERMQRMYGSPDEDRARILQFHRRNAERTIAERADLPSRFSRYEAI
jgi:hypothetical protein